jgi:hypothetical protein
MQVVATWAGVLPLGGVHVARGLTRLRDHPPPLGAAFGLQGGLCLPGRHQPDLEPDVWCADHDCSSLGDRGAGNDTSQLLAASKLACIWSS